LGFLRFIFILANSAAFLVALLPILNTDPIFVNANPAAFLVALLLFLNMDPIFLNVLVVAVISLFVISIYLV